MSAPTGRGRGRGRGTTLPAWMTRPDGPAPPAAAAVGGLPLPTPGHGRGRGADRGLDRPSDRSRDDRDRDRERDRDRDRDRDRAHRDRREDDRRRPDHPPAQQRGHRGLGYDDRAGRDRALPWERDRSTGRGRGRTDDVPFVRGEVGHDRDRERERDYRDRDRGREDRERAPPAGTTRGAETIGTGRGRGRGRGRGGGINTPAWMTAASGPTGDAPSPSAPRPPKDETMEKLLAQARQVQRERTRRDEERRDERTERAERGADPSRTTLDGKESKANTDDDLQKQRRREREEAAKKAEEERKEAERAREEEEQRQLLALVDDLPDKDSSDKKRKEITSNDDDGLFEFETEEEREERLARQRREERRKKMRKLEESNGHDGDERKVDRPRNPAGVIQSEMNGDANGAEEVPTHGASAMEVDSGPNLGAEVAATTQNAESTKDDSGEDSFDIFAADNATPVPTQSSKTAVTTDAQECDDAEGYYKAKINEIITLPKERGDGVRGSANGDDHMARFRVLGIIGKGVFSSVIKCVEETPAGGHGAAGTVPQRVIAMKIIRNNEVMARAAAKEVRILRILCQHRPRPRGKPAKKKDGENGDASNGDEEEDREERERRERENHNIVRLLDVDPSASSVAANDGQPPSSSAFAAPPPEFRSHCIFLFEFLPFNLREVLSKFGKNVGINLTAVRSYARQLLCALDHLAKHRVVHADLKPDNILVSANFSTIKLADFGSAFFETDHDNDPTPYLVSRFYRSPEIILGLEYDRMVDLWSAAVTLAELFTGSVLFPGKTNNDMLVRFMDTMGPISHKMVRRHSLSYTRMGLQPHFEVGITGGTYQLRKQDVDRVTGQPVCRLVNVLSAKPESRLAQILLRASKGTGASERVEVMKFADCLNRCLALDPARRLSVRDALRHEFFIKKKKKDDSTKREET